MSALLALADRVEAASLAELSTLCGAEVRPFRSQYAVTAQGDVWSRRRGKWTLLRPTTSTRGYGKLCLILDGQRRHLRLHRVICEAWHGAPPFLEAVARHLDDVRTNNHPDNLAWGSHSDNARDALRNGRSDPGANGRAAALKRRGEDNPVSKLTWDDVRRVRERAASGESCASIAKTYGVDRTNIWQIVQGITWKEGCHVRTK